MTEQEILDALKANDERTVRALLEKLVNQTDDTYLLERYREAEALREQLHALKGI